MKSYLTNRKQYVVFDSCQSEHTEICTGVPQGSILGPLFFCIDINDLITVSDRLNFLMYADDTTIYFNLEGFSNIFKETDINNELEKVNTWLKLNKLSLTLSGLMSLNPIRSGLFQTANDPGRVGFKSHPPPLRSRKLLCQSSPYHICAFYQVFWACSSWNFSKIRDFDHFTVISK